ncbi:pyridoxal phosphate-dependent aminotransferase [Psychrobacillus lasiicapitis]|uniref:Aminotransferase n=1 Tax=Psychrobacillus lasiicapitis TaxID=1636719 RepID=A0A544TC01_9BACI|nr:aminotransferase class I/II-fold pyridoxal phosphate-dependent enzyme [Psychrobacillus lasiicapitis]TQR14987.1 pyridoxal phosphate-dependent class II aminotransferase [Psychrobacillus lasiicapitis]GGA21559.1 threonine-phosphate decarboxylase [Psychrobacillus lasiicapitis]
MALPNHGANAHHVYERLGIEMPEKIMDFSENVNPLGPPAFVMERWSTYAELITKYPDPAGEPFLSAAAKYHDVSVSNIIVGNGAAELFASIAKRYENKRVVLIHPTFSEYAATLAPYHVYIKEIIAIGQLPLEEVFDEIEFAEAIYICRPNNPTGYLIPLEEIIQIVRYAKRYKCEVILDEAFLDFIDEKESFIPYLKDFPNVVVVRSMTKMYAIPGLRLGYAVGSEAFIKDIRSRLSHWNSNAIATTIGADCLQEEEYRIQAITFAKEMREGFSDFLEKWHCIVLPSTTNFLCFQLPDHARSKAFFDYLLAKGCVLRHTENFKGLDGKWFRVGMKEKAQMEHLQREMTTWFEENLSS